MDRREIKLLSDLILDVKKDVSAVKKDIADIKEDLFMHISRTEASEARLDVQEQKLDHFVEQMEPVKEHVKTVHLLTRALTKGLKILVAIATLVATVAGLVKFR
jgi:hypothetical protein